jgi:predicted NAD/FAD-binding protein
MFEALPRPGGHTNTVDISEDGRSHPVDTGFMVYNEVTYPRLTRLFEELGVETMETDMSFGVQDRTLNLEYCGSGPAQLFAQKRNLLRPGFHAMLADIVRFNRLAVKALDNPDLIGMSLRQFVEKHRFGRRFRDSYLVPMTSAIWSTPPDEMLNFPAHTLLRFLHNHGLLGVRTQHQWRTVKGGSRQYRDKLLAPFREQVHCGCPVRVVEPSEDGVRIRFADDRTSTFDRVVIATHADRALAMIPQPDRRQSRILGSFAYSRNRITLHSDPSVMPRHRRAWASWNYRIDPLPDGRHQASTHYWMNSLQRLRTRNSYFVSVNGSDLVDRENIISEFTFNHPMFSQAAAEAQFELPLLNENGKLYFCGSYFRYGFHEDGLMAGEAAAERLLSHLSDTHAKLPV